MKSTKLLLFVLGLAVVVVFAAVATLPAAAQGNREQVQGTYSITGDNACLLSPAGFNANLTPAGPSSVQSSSVQGTLEINADGTGTGQFTELILTHPPASTAGASSSEYSVSFTYTIADDGTLTVSFTSVGGTIVTGPLAGMSFTVTPPPLNGRVARDGSAILLSSIGPSVETLHIVGGPTIPRICHRTRVQIPVHVNGQN
jgi:hypothetical protein